MKAAVAKYNGEIRRKLNINMKSSCRWLSWLPSWLSGNGHQWRNRIILMKYNESMQPAA